MHFANPQVGKFGWVPRPRTARQIEASIGLLKLERLLVQRRADLLDAQIRYEEMNLEALRPPRPMFIIRPARRPEPVAKRPSEKALRDAHSEDFFSKRLAALTPNQEA